MALPWLIKGGIDSALHQGAAQVFPLKYPLLILGAAALQGVDHLTIGFTPKVLHPHVGRLCVWIDAGVREMRFIRRETEV